jgi:hypothetical protein
MKSVASNLANLKPNLEWASLLARERLATQDQRRLNQNTDPEQL